jgi:hypothetical protein
MSNATLQTDAVALVEQLDEDAILEQLVELHRRTRALQVLLRAARARKRRQAASSKTELREG